MDSKNQLIELLQFKPKNHLIPRLITGIESQQVVDFQSDLNLLKGVWELRWSSSTQPRLKQAFWLENLQVLDPEQQRGVNLLRLSGPLGSLAMIAVEAKLSVNSSNQIGVQFERGGWLGPSLPNRWRPKLQTKINQAFPAWLDITFIDETLRICRGNAGTCFALLKRDDLEVTDWIPTSSKNHMSSLK